MIFSTLFHVIQCHIMYSIPFKTSTSLDPLFGFHNALMGGKWQFKKTLPSGEEGWESLMSNQDRAQLMRDFPMWQQQAGGWAPGLAPPGHLRQPPGLSGLQFLH